MNSIKIVKLITGEEVISYFFEPEESEQYVRLEYPLIIEWDVDPDNGYPETELYPFVYGMKVGSPIFVPVKNLLTAPIEPSKYIKALFEERASKISSQAETLALAERERDKPQKRRLGK